MDRIVKILQKGRHLNTKKVHQLREAYQKMSQELHQYGIDCPWQNDRDFFRIEIIYTSLKNKQRMEEYYEQLKNRLFDIWEFFTYEERKQCIDEEMVKAKDGPFFYDSQGNLIRIAFFDCLLNTLYDKEMIIFDLPQYFRLEKDFNTRMIDVDSYGYQPYNAGFSSCEPLLETADGYALFNRYTKSIYIITPQRFLQFAFDRHKDDRHFVFTKLQTLAEALLAGDPEPAVRALIDSQLCSPYVDRKLNRFQRQLKRQKGN